MEDKRTQEDMDLEELEEATMLYDEISEIFIKHNTTLKMSYTVVAAMADSLYAYLISIVDEE